MKTFGFARDYLVLGRVLRPRRPLSYIHSCSSCIDWQVLHFPIKNAYDIPNLDKL